MPEPPYHPAPLDTTSVPLPSHVDQLIERLAENIHDVWASQRIREGWTLGPARDDEKKQHPCLIPYDNLPESEKEYDRATVRGSIQAILAMGYDLVPPESEADQATQPADPLHALLEDRSKLKETSISQLRRLWQERDMASWAIHPESFTRLAEALTHRDQPFWAYDVASEGLKFSSSSVRLKQLQALALARTGAPQAAHAILEALVDDGHDDVETLGILARVHKDLARASVDGDQRKHHLDEAYHLYHSAFTKHNDYYPGINAAFVSLLRGRPDRAREIAAGVRELCEREGEAEGANYWNLATLGEASLILGQTEQARDWYGRAVATASGEIAKISSTRLQAQEILQLLPGTDFSLDEVISLPTIAVFTGHRVDDPGRGQDRFPASETEHVKAAIATQLAEWNAGIGYASAASGADLLFLEAMLDRAGSIHVVLPFEPEAFRRLCVTQDTDASWGDRFDRILQRATTVTCVSMAPPHDDPTIYTYANEILLGLARLRGRQLKTTVNPLAVWDGVSDAAEGGTGHCVRTWEKAGVQVAVLPPSSKAHTRGAGHATRQHLTGVRQQVKAALFADVVGYSKLPEAEIPVYLEEFMERVGRLCDESGHAPEVRNTWGDAFYFVFPNVGDAAHFALALRELVTAVDWEALGLSQALRIRIALHAGPMFPCVDPVTKQKSYTGSHVSRTARIEPIAEENQIFASQPFAALAALNNLEEFEFEYAGERPLAKKYGSDMLFVLRATGSGN